MKVKFLGKGVIWNPSRNKAWCEFAGGEFVTDDDKTIAALRAMGVPEGSLLPPPPVVSSTPPPVAPVGAAAPAVPFVDPEDIPVARVAAAHFDMAESASVASESVEEPAVPVAKVAKPKGGKK